MALEGVREAMVVEWEGGAEVGVDWEGVYASPSAGAIAAQKFGWGLVGAHPSERKTESMLNTEYLPQAQRAC